MNGILGKKLGMTHIFGEDGSVIPVTVVETHLGTAVSIRTKENNGYEAVQGGFEECKESRLSKPVLGQFKKAGLSPMRHLHEFEISEGETVEAGSTWDLSIFEGTEKVSVSGTSKGRGFAGTTKRYGFTRGPETHGSHNIRAPGSIGACAYPGRVFPGQKLPGQYGNKRVTVKNLQVVKVDVNKNLMFIKGAVPGPINGIVLIKKE
jgi:large subunit ribosomal protein L3